MEDILPRRAYFAKGAKGSDCYLVTYPFRVRPDFANMQAIATDQSMFIDSLNMD